MLSNTEDRSQSASISLILAPEGVGGLYLLSKPDAPTVKTFQLLSPRAATDAFGSAQLCDADCGACNAVPEFDAVTLDAGVTYSLQVAGEANRQPDGIRLAPP